MVKLVRGQTNRIAVKVTATINYTGFSAVLRVNGFEKKIPTLKDSSIYIDFTADEVFALGEGYEGELTVFNAKNEAYIKNLVYFGPVETLSDAIGYQKIPIVLVSMVKYEGGRNAVSKAVEKWIEDKVTETVDAVLDETIDEKVDAAVDTVVTETVVEKVDEQISLVLDDKVEECVNSIFEDSDSDTIGGAFIEMQEAVFENIEPRVQNIEIDIDDNIKPRLQEVEQTLEKKIEMDYDDSDEDITFLDGLAVPKEEDSSED